MMTSKLLIVTLSFIDTDLTNPSNVTLLYVQMNCRHEKKNPLEPLVLGRCDDLLYNYDAIDFRSLSMDREQF